MRLCFHGRWNKLKDRFHERWQRVRKNVKDVLYDFIYPLKKATIIGFSSLFLFAASHYIKPSLARPDEVEISRNVNVHTKIYANEAGSSVTVGGFYKDFVGLEGGMIYFNNFNAYPLLLLSGNPSHTFTFGENEEYGSLGLLYQGRLALTNINSTLYTSHSFGVGYSIPVKDFRFSLGGLVTGSTSYPLFDATYLNLVPGISVDWKHLLFFYTTMNFYLAAPDPMKTAYIGYYDLRYQNVKFGLDATWKGYTLETFFVLDSILSQFGVGFLRAVNLGSLKGNIWISGGIGQWTKKLGGDMEFVMSGGITLFMPGQVVDTHHRVEVDRITLGGMPGIETDINTQPDKRPLTPSEKVYGEKAQKNLLAAKTFDNFTGMYKNASVDEKIWVARWLGRTLGDVAYSYDVLDKLTNFKFFDPDVKKVASAGYQDIFAYLQAYSAYYQAHGTYKGMPEDLKKGIAICAGIHSLMAEFLRQNGVNALAVSVATRRGLHVVTLIPQKGKTMILDYGDLVRVNGPADEAIRLFGSREIAPTFYSQMFSGDGYIGTLETPEGTLLKKTIGVDSQRALENRLLKKDY